MEAICIISKYTQTGPHPKTQFCIFGTLVRVAIQGRIQDLIGGGAQIVTGLKLPFWGISFVEFWCWGLIFGGQGGPGPPPGSAPAIIKLLSLLMLKTC